MTRPAAGTPAPPVYTNHLFVPLARELIRLVRSIPIERWNAPTCYPTWTVHDIATHLIQTALGRLSAQRDGYRPSSDLRRAHGEEQPGGELHETDFEPLAKLIDTANTRWQQTLQNLSPRIVVEILASSETSLARYLSHLPRTGKAPISVAWAGEAESERWFDTARELTERWHHQQQIREAVGAPAIDRPVYLRPVIATLVRAVPHWYGSIRAPEGTTVHIEVSGRSGGSWELTALASGWRLFEGRAGRRRDSGGGSIGRTPDATVSLSEDTAWRFLTRSISAEWARPLIALAGERELGEPFLSVVGVMIPAVLR